MRIDAKASGTHQGSHRSQLTAGTHEAVFVPDPSDIFSIVSICMCHGQRRTGGDLGSGEDILGQYAKPISLASKHVCPVERTDSETSGLCTLAAWVLLPSKANLLPQIFC